MLSFELSIFIVTSKIVKKTSNFFLIYFTIFLIILRKDFCLTVLKVKSISQICCPLIIIRQFYCL